VEGAFEATMRGIRSCIEEDQKVGLRLTLTKHTMGAIDDIFDIAEEHRISRICFYHLAYAGRGKRIQPEDLTHDETRRAIDKIITRTKHALEKGQSIEVLTVDNAVDGTYLYLKLLDENPAQAESAFALLNRNGGGRFSSGVGIANIDAQGTVHPDQFWQHYSLGNVRERPFHEIWSNPDEPLLIKLRDRLTYLTGRCQRCRFLEICGGALRVRAEVATGDRWAPDPACYLSDSEIGALEHAA
jgi:radical SAM protein with 4Fe4S-binding SPASM domain